MNTTKTNCSKRMFAFFILFFVALSLQFAQDMRSEEKETDPLVLQNLEEWQDLKFGFMMHWGPYSQWGVVESWSICSEDVPWCQRKMDNYIEYVNAYEKLKDTFNPIDFDPESWAKIAKEAGMKYVVFTTKHHDGFSMFDTKLTDYNITDPDCAFHANPKANITKEIFEAFRNENFKTGAYFSKPDWHSDYYWWPYFATPTRHVNYNPVKYPERWQMFKDFTYGQIEELMTGYGRVDILWLDGGWVRPRPELDSDKPIKPPFNQDIEMPKIAAMARSHQPGLIIVDRTVKGKYENYTTPEQHIPEKALDYPWETCMTMGGSWSYVPNDTFKSTRTIIHNLVDIVAKGGNYLLNVGPGPDGNLPADAIIRMKEIGMWMEVNGKAIYKTRAIVPYKEGNICFTENPDKSINAIYLNGKEEEILPDEIQINSFSPEKNTKVYLHGYSKALKWKTSQEGFVISIPNSLKENPPCENAWSFVITKIKQ